MKEDFSWQKSYNYLVCFALLLDSHHPFFVLSSSLGQSLPLIFGPLLGRTALCTVPFFSRVPCDEPLSPCGSILYMAPELLEMTGGTSVDWWTMGILMHEMLTGVSPWKNETQSAVSALLRAERKSPKLLFKQGCLLLLFMALI